MVHTKLRPYEVWEPPTGHQKMTRRLHELLPLGLQHALRDRYLGSAFDSGVKASALLVGLRYPRAVLKCVCRAVLCCASACVCDGKPNP
jgi:hypothetical protein